MVSHAPTTAGELVEAVIRYDDAGALVSIYRGGERTDRYYVHAEDGDPRAGIADGVRIIERREGAT